MINYFSKDLDTVTDELVFKEQLDCFLKRIGFQLGFQDLDSIGFFKKGLDLVGLFKTIMDLKLTVFLKDRFLKNVRILDGFIGLNKGLWKEFSEEEV